MLTIPMMSILIFLGFIVVAAALIIIILLLCGIIYGMAHALLTTRF